MSGLFDRIRELRLRYGPLVKLAEKSPRFRSLIERSPVLRPVLERLKPQPMTPEEFAEELQRTLVNSGQGTTVLIFSPFLYEDAVEHYIGAIETAARKGARIVVHTLAPDHRSVRRRDAHRRLIERLRAAGVEVVERRNMHEKAVVVLGEGPAAYFGSLNPLAKHSGSADYMLKFTHPEIVEALSIFLQTLAEESEREAEEA